MLIPVYKIGAVQFSGRYLSTTCFYKTCGNYLSTKRLVQGYDDCSSVLWPALYWETHTPQIEGSNCMAMAIDRDVLE